MTEENTEALPIYKLMSKVMGELGAIEKSNINKHQNYAFRGIDDVMNALNPILTKHGVFFVPYSVASNAHEWVTTKSGGIQHSTVVVVCYRFYGPLGDFIQMEAAGESADSSDKSTQQAMSQALKSGLLQTFCVRTEESVDNEPDGKSPEFGAASTAQPGFELESNYSGPRTDLSPLITNFTVPQKTRLAQWLRSNFNISGGAPGWLTRCLESIPEDGADKTRRAVKEILENGES